MPTLSFGWSSKPEKIKLFELEFRFCGIGISNYELYSYSDIGFRIGLGALLLWWIGVWKSGRSVIQAPKAATKSCSFLNP